MQTGSNFTPIIFSLAILVLCNTVVTGVVAVNALGCPGATKVKEGADISFYSYEYGSKIYQEEDFFRKLYATENLNTISSYTGDLEFYYEAKSEEVPERGDIYGYETTFTNFTAAITGYYFAQETGEHTFQLFMTIGAASLRIGAGVENCSGFVDKDITKAFAINTFETMEGVEPIEFSLHLEKDVAYPIEFLVNNWKDHVFFAPFVTLPSGDDLMLNGLMLSLIPKTD